jgi:hypothetical protein
MFQKKITILTSMIFLIIANNMAYSKDLISLQPINPLVNQPTHYTTISVEWTASTEAGDSYYAAFSKGITYALNEYNPSAPENVPDHVITPVQQFSHAIDSTSLSFETDDAYYFNIIIDSEGEYGATSSIGPFVIDTTKPAPVNVSGVTSTDRNSIQLTIDPADANQVCILLNTTNILSCDWGDIPENRNIISPTLSEGNNLVYAFFKDLAGNTNQAIHSVKYAPVDFIPEQTTVKVATIPTLSEWGLILLMGMLLFSSVLIMGRKKF